jgi:hypothetical protein
VNGKNGTKTAGKLDPSAPGLDEMKRSAQARAKRIEKATKLIEAAGGAVALSVTK